MATTTTPANEYRTGRSREVFSWLFPPLPAIDGGGFIIPGLDGIRAISILMVIVAHCGLARLVPGGLGVTVFFFLSGYLITTLMRRESAKTGTVDLTNFYIRRCLRILPPCYAVILVALGVAVAAGERLSLDGIVANAAYFTNYYAAFQPDPAMIPGLEVLWSLAIEEHFYLFFPLIFLAILPLSRRKQGMILAAICVAVLAWRCVLIFGYGVRDQRTYLGTDTRLDAILWGCVLAVAANPALGDRWGVRLASWKLGVLALAVMVFCLVFRATWFRETFRYSIQSVALMPLFALAIRQSRSGFLSCLNHYAFRLIGVYSYNLYLVHFVILHYTFGITNPRFLASFPVVAGLSFLLAGAMYRLIDLPTAEVRQRYSVASGPVMVEKL